MIAFGLRPRLAHQSQKVPMKESSDVFFAESTLGQHFVEPLQIGNAIEIHRALLKTEAAIKIASNSDMIRVTSDLADMVDVIENIFQFNADRVRR
jgi:hypothetical protein